MAAEDKIQLVLTIEYDGTHFHGSQSQRHGPTVQQELEKAIAKLTGSPARVNLASRTDAGVSALGQVASFRSKNVPALDKVLSGLNHYLPDDIAVQSVYLTPESLDVRRHAVSREYCYRIWNSPTPSPIEEKRAYRVTGTLDTELMNQAASLLVGTHDMAVFATKLGQSTKNTVRTVHEASVTRNGREVVFRMRAVSFLPHQVRNTVGSLIRVGKGRLTIDEFKDLVRAGAPGSAGPAVPGHGLCLVNINYSKDLGDYDENL